MRTLSNCARLIDRERLRERTVLEHLCASHGGRRSATPTDGYVEGGGLPESESGAAYYGPDVLVVNLDDTMLPMLVTAGEHGDSVEHHTRQNYLDDLRRRETMAATLETLRLTLQTKRGRPLMFAFAYNREASLRTVRDLIRSGCAYSETPTFSDADGLVRYLESL